MQTKASRQSLEAFLVLYNRLEEQLETTLDASTRARDETLSAMESCLRNLEEENPRREELLSAIRRLEAESRIFDETLRSIRLLMQTYVPKARTHFEESLRILDALMALRNEFTVVSNSVGGSLSTGKLQRHHHSSQGVNLGVKRLKRSEILNQALEQASQLIAPSKYERHLKGKFGEMLFIKTCTARGQEVTDLNAIKTNMPGYDVKVGNEWVSVKVLGTAGKPSLCSYRHTLDVLTEHSNPAKSGEFAGQGLTQYVAQYILDNNELAERFSREQSVKALSKTLKENGCLAIPDDHAEELEAYLKSVFREHILKNPKRYRIDQAASPKSQEEAVEAIIEDYCRRIRPIGFTSREIDLTLESELLTNNY